MLGSKGIYISLHIMAWIFEEDWSALLESGVLMTELRDHMIWKKINQQDEEFERLSQLEPEKIPIEFMMCTSAVLSITHNAPIIIRSPRLFAKKFLALPLERKKWVLDQLIRMVKMVHNSEGKLVPRWYGADLYSEIYLSIVDFRAIDKKFNAKPIDSKDDFILEAVKTAGVLKFTGC